MSSLLFLFWLTTLPGESKFVPTTDQRLIIAVSTNKAVYRNGETLQWRGNVFAASSLDPLTATVQHRSTVVFTVESPRGDTVFSATSSVSLISEINGNFTIPADWAGGIYTIRVQYPGAPPTLRSFEIRAFNNPRISITIDFVRNGYGADEEATAIITATRSEGGPAANAMLSASAFVDGEEVKIHGLSDYLDDKGTGFVRVYLPNSIPGAGEGTLTVTVDDSGTVESKGQTIPILVQQLDVRIYPEGGALVYGVLNYVYVQAYTNQGDPADITAVLETASSSPSSPSSSPSSPSSLTPPSSSLSRMISTISSVASVIPTTTAAKPTIITINPKFQIPANTPATTATSPTFSTTHEGRGRFCFVPIPDTSYVLRIVKPHTVSLPIPIPPSLFSNESVTATIHADQTSYEFGSPITATVSISSLGGGSAREEDYVYRLELARRDTMLASKLVFGRTSNQGIAEVHVALTPKPAGTNQEILSQGVLRLTLYRILDDGASVPVAERLIFQHFAPERTLNVAITSAPPNKPVSPDSIQMITSDLNSLTPGDWVELSVSVTNSVTGIPVQGLVGVSVTDAASENIIDQRKRNPRLREMVLLEQEVVDLTDCDAYFPPLPGSSPLLPPKFTSASASVTLNSSSSSPSPSTAKTTLSILQSTALDLLLATQGWRRFVFVNSTVQNQVLTTSEQPIQKAAQMLVGSPFDYHPPRPQSRHIRYKRAGMGLKYGEEAQLERAMFNAMEDDVRESEATGNEDEDGEGRKGEGEGAGGVVREFAKDPPRPRQRVSFTDTIYWAAASTTDAQGQLKFRFQLSDAITTFHVSVDVFEYDTAYKPTTGLSLGRGDLTFSSKLPFYAEPKLPLQLTAGDHALVPVSLVSSLRTPVVVSTTVKLGNVVGITPTAVDIGDSNTFNTSPPTPPPGTILQALSVDHVNSTDVNAKSRSRALVGMKALQTPYYSSAMVSMDFVTIAHSKQSSSSSTTTTMGSDMVTRSLLVFPSGFPQVSTSSGILTVDPTVNTEVSTQFHFNEKSLISGSASVAIRLYPSPLSDLMTALESLIAEPGGCFEQTSATSYPLVMALRYFQTQPLAPLTLIQRASDILSRAYKRLIGFETAERGFEWFGGAPGHEALTAYGLAQFLDMKGVHNVDQGMLSRTKDWLLARRTSDLKGFQRNPRALDTFGRAPELTTDAYIAWSLANSGVMNATSGQDFSALVNRLEESRTSTQDPYVLALIAGVLLKQPSTTSAPRIAQGQDLAKKLIQYQAESGAIKGAITSITGSQDESLEIEATAIAVLTWLDASLSGSEPDTKLSLQFQKSADLALRWLLSKRNGGRFGSTQGTVLALKAIIAMDKVKASQQVDMIASLEVDGHPTGDPVVFGPSTLKEKSDNKNGIVALPDVGQYLQQNTPHTITLKIKPKNPVSSSSSSPSTPIALPYSVHFSFNTATPPISSDSSPLKMKLTSSSSSPPSHSVVDGSINDPLKLSLHEGDGIQLSLEVSNTADVGHGMVVAVVGIPGGMELRSEQLSQLVKQNSIAFYETMRSGGQLVLYWRDFPPNGKKTVLIDLTATIPGDFVAAPSTVYLYYNDANKFFIPGIVAHITPRS